jgi:hypothetical protein
LGTIAYPAEAAGLAADPADELFMNAMELADQLGREGIRYDCIINIDEPTLVFGWRGWLLRQTTLRQRPISGWDVGTFNRGGEGNQRLALGMNGRLYLARPSRVYGGDDQLPLLDDVIDVDYQHFGAGSFAENMLHRLERFAVQVRRR